MSTFYYYRGRVAAAELLRSVGVKKGDCVAIQAFTCSAVPEAVLSIGAIPVFADIASDHLNMSLDALKTLVSKCPSKPRAVIVQYTFGTSREVSDITSWAVNKGIAVVEDRCHMDFFADDFPPESQSVGAFYSFEWGKKNIAGLGGAVVSRDEAIQQALSMRLERFSSVSLKNELVMAAKLCVFGLTKVRLLRRFIKKLYRHLTSRGVIEGNNTISDRREFPDYSKRMSRVSYFTLHLGQMILRFTRGEGSKTEVSELQSLPCLYSTAIGEMNVAELLRVPLTVDDKDYMVQELDKKLIDVSEMYETVVQPLVGAELKSIGYEAGSCPNAERATKTVISIKARPGHESTVLKAVLSILEKKSLG